MEREIWNALRSAIAAVDFSFPDNPRFAHRTAKIVNVYLWAALHERCIDWACQSRHWYHGAPERRTGALPDQSTMSRRTRQRDGRLFHAFLDQLAAHLSKNPDPRFLDLKRLDGKPLLVANELFQWAHLRQHPLIAPRRPATKLGHRKHRAARLRSIELLEHPALGLGGFGIDLLAERKDIERRFGNLSCGVGGLQAGLPPFVRRIWRVRNWMKAKLLIYAGRCVANTEHSTDTA